MIPAALLKRQLCIKKCIIIIVIIKKCCLGEASRKTNRKTRSDFRPHTHAEIKVLMQKISRYQDTTDEGVRCSSIANVARFDTEPQSMGLWEHATDE